MLPEKKLKNLFTFIGQKIILPAAKKNTKSVIAQMPTVGMAMAVGNRKEDAVCSH